MNEWVSVRLSECLYVWVFTIYTNSSTDWKRSQSERSWASAWAVILARAALLRRNRDSTLHYSREIANIDWLTTFTYKKKLQQQHKGNILSFAFFYQCVALTSMPFTVSNVVVCVWINKESREVQKRSTISIVWYQRTLAILIIMKWCWHSQLLFTMVKISCLRSFFLSFFLSICAYLLTLTEFTISK